LSAPPPGRSNGNSQRGRRIALFGGTFDPIHAGHLAVARAAQRRFRLDQVFFIPVSHPPHKRSSEMLPFAHRFALVALACAGHARFVPSLAEAATNGRSDQVFYSVDTVRRFRREFGRPGDRLYFLMGVDSFLQIATWRKYKTLLGLCDFVVASRPGFRSEMLARAIAPELLARPRDGVPARKSQASASLALRRTTVHLLDTVASHVSATDVRHRLERGQSICGLVPRGVEEYIKKQELYRVEALHR
jgi:nicotinate-nucleotide adenylyltransferase